MTRFTAGELLDLEMKLQERIADHASRKPGEELRLCDPEGGYTWSDERGQNRFVYVSEMPLLANHEIDPRTILDLIEEIRELRRRA